jgi:hypothetical protein
MSFLRELRAVFESNPEPVVAWVIIILGVLALWR